MVKVALDKSETAETETKAVPKRKKSRWLLKLVVLLVILFVTAPSLISISGQARTLMSKLHPRLSDAVSFQSVQLHWWAPVEITKLQVRDLSDAATKADAPLLCEAARVTTIEPLWRILLNAGRGTGVVVASPRLSLIADEQGTNIDRTITAIFGDATETNDRRFPFRLTISDGEVQLRTPVASASDPTLTAASAPDTATPPESTGKSGGADVVAVVSSINGTFSTMDTERWLPEMKLTAKIHQQSKAAVAKSTGSGDKRPSRPTRLAAGLDEVVNDFPDVPLEDLAGTDEHGDTESARIQIHLKPRADEKGRQTIQIGARSVDLRLLQPLLSMLGLKTSCDGVISGGIDARLAGADLKDGLVGRMMLQGENVRVRQQEWTRDEWLELGNVDFSGAVAIADDGMLIQNLKIKTDIAELSGSGELRHRPTLNSVSNETPSRQQVEITGSVDIARLASSLRETLTIHPDVTIERGRLTFGLRGSAGSVEEVAVGPTPSGNSADATVESDSSTAVNALIRPVALTGSASQLGNWQLVVKTEDLAAVRAGKPLSVDSSMRLDAVGPFVGGLPELSKARLTADFGTVDCAPDGKAWKISGIVQPEALWQQLHQFVDVPQPGLRGDISFQSRLAVDSETIQLTDLQLNSSDVKVSSLALAIIPSRPVTSMLDGTVHVEGTGAAIRTLLTPWHDAFWLAERSIVVSDLTATPTREIQLTVRISPENVATVQRSKVLSVSNTSNSAAGSHTASEESSIKIDEADVALSMLAKDAGRQFEIQKGSIKVPGLVALVTGTVTVPEDDLLLDLSADTTYDLDVLSRRLLGSDSDLSFSGQGRDTFKLTGSASALSGIAEPATAKSASAAALKGTGTVNWTSGDVWGLQVGKAAVQATLENNLLRSLPIQCSLNGGQMNVMPQYDLASSRLQLGTGSRIQNLQLTPDLCRTWLGYVAPMLADTAEVNGEVSVRVERFLWDFNSPENSDVSGQLTVHKAQASPGTSLATMLQVVDLLRRKDDNSESTAERSLVLPEQTIPVQIRQGFVAHEGLIMELSGYQLKTSGAVGLNKQLQMTIEVPLEKTAAGRAARSVRVPLGGTISQPQPDTSALLQNLGTQKIQEKLGDEVDKTLNKQLNKLFDKF